MFQCEPRKTSRNFAFTFAAVLSCLIAQSATAQVSLRGTVVDQQSGAALAGAQVTVTGTSTGVTTDATGAFTLRSSRAITSVSVLRVGYQAKTMSVSGSGPVRIELTATATELPGIQVTARQTDGSTSTLTRGDIDRFDGTGLVDALNTLPGVFMQSRTPLGGAHVDIRGYYPSVGGNSPNSNNIGSNVFLNGIPITDASGLTVLDDVDFGTIGSVQVIKGPASSLYGSGIGGTLLLGTAHPTPNQTSIGQQFISGGDGLIRSNSTLQSSSGKSDFVLNYGRHDYNSFRDHSESRKTYVRATGNYQVSDKQTLSAYFSYNKSFEELAGEIDSTDFYAGKPVTDDNYLANNSHIAITSFFTGVSDTRHFGEHFSNTSSFFASGRFSNQPFAHGFTDATQFNFGVRSAFGYSTQAGKVGIDGTLGVMAQRSNVTSNGVFIVPAPPFTERPSASENYAVNSFAFTEWKFALPNQVRVTAGLSMINNSFTVQNMLKSNQLFDTTTIIRKKFDALFAPRIEVAKGLGGNALVYVSASTGYTPPLLSTVVQNDGTLNTSLKPEKGIQYEAGLQGTLRGRLTGQIAVFDLDNTDKLTTQTVSTVTSTVNIGKQRNQGAELSASWMALSNGRGEISMLRPWASYTYNNAKYIDFKSDNNNTASTVDFSGNRVARVPKSRYAIGADINTKHGITLNGTYQYVGDVPITFDNSTFVKSYNLLSAKVGYRTKLAGQWDLNLAAGGDNLTSSKYYTFVFVGPNYKGLAQAQDGGTGDGYLIPGNPSARYYVSAGLSYIIK